MLNQPWLLQVAMAVLQVTSDQLQRLHRYFLDMQGKAYSMPIIVWRHELVGYELVVACSSIQRNICADPTNLTFGCLCMQSALG